MYLDYRPARIAAVAVTLLQACSSTSSDSNPASTPTTADGGPTASAADAGVVDNDAPPSPPPVSALARATLKAKSGARLLADLADGLSLPRADVCRELGTIDCLEVHGISLLEVEPRFLRIQTPIDGLVTGVMAVDRIALHACANRVDADLNNEADPPLVPELSLGLEAPATRAAVVDRLAQRLVRRNATEGEQLALSQAYDELSPADRDRVWVTVTCFALATLTENLFY